MNAASTRSNQIGLGLTGPLDRVYAPKVELLDSFITGLSDSVPKIPKSRDSEFSLPGHGTRSVGCGSPVPFYCRTHGESIWVRSHCGNRGCPACAERWGKAEAQASSRRLAWGAKTVGMVRTSRMVEVLGLARLLLPSIASRAFDQAQRHLVPRLRLCHVVVSMPDDVGDADYCRRLAYSVVGKHGIDGGVAIFHPWRRDKDRHYVPDGYWHWHIVGVNFGDVAPGGNDKTPDGRPVVFVHLDDDEYDDYGGLRSQAAISRLVQYLLSHAGLRIGRHAYTYFGCVSPRSTPEALVQRWYPECLTEGSKPYPVAKHCCPVDGSDELEPCEEQYWMEGRVRPVGVHPLPSYEPTPDVVDLAKSKLEGQLKLRLEDGIRNLNEKYGITEWKASWPKAYRRAIARLEKSVDVERARFMKRENLLYNSQNRLVQMWCWIEAYLTEESFTTGDWRLVHMDEIRGAVPAQDRECFERVFELNLRPGELRPGQRPGRLHLTHDGYLSLIREYDLEDALADLRRMVNAGYAVRDGRDLLLEQLLSPPSGMLTDMEFVFGPYLDRAQAGCSGVE